MLLPFVLLERSFAMEPSFTTNITFEPDVTVLTRLSVHFPHMFLQIRLRGEELTAELTIFILLVASVMARIDGMNDGLNVGTKCEIGTY